MTTTSKARQHRRRHLNRFTFVLIDEQSGFVWGGVISAQAQDPISACRAIDASIGEHGRSYEDIGGEQFNGRSGYHVHMAPYGYAVDDGQDQDAIDEVSRFPVIARIVVTGAEE